MHSATNDERSEEIAELCSRIFRGDEFRWSLGMRSDSAEAFFAPQDASGQLLAEKKGWLEQGPDLYVAATPEANRLIREAWDLAIHWQHVKEPTSNRTIRALAEAWEPDLLLIERDTMSLVAGCVCFPSSWDLRLSIGKPVHEIHEVVPQLNSQLGHKIDRLLHGVQSGKSFSRMNWGISRSSERNYHPDLKRRQLDESVAIEELFLRIEHQIFTGMESGLMMGLRIESLPLTQLPIGPDLWAAASRLIRTMPADIARYKNMHTALDAISEAMDQHLAERNV